MKYLFNKTNPKNILIFFLAFLLSYFFLNLFHHPVSILSIIEISEGHTILNVLPYYNSEIAYEHLSSYPEEAIKIYYRVLLYDFFILVPVYVTFFSMAIFYLLKKTTKLSPGLTQKIAYIPIIAGVLNIIEDIVVAILLNKLPEQLTSLASISAILTTSKSLIILISLLSIIVMFSFLGVKTIIKKLN